MSYELMNCLHLGTDSLKEPLLEGNRSRLVSSEGDLQCNWLHTTSYSPIYACPTIYQTSTNLPCLGNTIERAEVGRLRETPGEQRHLSIFSPPIMCLILTGSGNSIEARQVITFGLWTKTACLCHWLSHLFLCLSQTQ